MNLKNIIKTTLLASLPFQAMAMDVDSVFMEHIRQRRKAIGTQSHIFRNAGGYSANMDMYVDDGYPEDILLNFESTLCRMELTEFGFEGHYAAFDRLTRGYHFSDSFEHIKAYELRDAVNSIVNATNPKEFSVYNKNSFSNMARSTIDFLVKDYARVQFEVALTEKHYLSELSKYVGCIEKADFMLKNNDVSIPVSFGILKEMESKFLDSLFINYLYDIPDSLRNIDSTDEYVSWNLLKTKIKNAEDKFLNNSDVFKRLSSDSAHFKNKYNSFLDFKKNNSNNKNEIKRLEQDLVNLTTKTFDYFFNVMDSTVYREFSDKLRRINYSCNDKYNSDERITKIKERVKKVSKETYLDDMSNKVYVFEKDSLVIETCDRYTIMKDYRKDRDVYHIDLFNDGVMDKSVIVTEGHIRDRGLLSIEGDAVGYRDVEPNHPETKPYPQIEKSWKVNYINPILKKAERLLNINLHEKTQSKLIVQKVN